MIPRSLLAVVVVHKHNQIWIAMISKCNYRHHRSSSQFEDLNLNLHDTHKMSGQLGSCSPSTHLRAARTVPSFSQPSRGPPLPFQTSAKPQFENSSRSHHQIWLYLYDLSWERPIPHFELQEWQQNIDRPAKSFRQETYLVSDTTSGTLSWISPKKVWFRTSRSRI